MVANAEYVHHSKTIQEALQNPKTYVDGLAQQIQMDLVDMNKFSYKNKGNRWILTVLEVLSRYAFAVPVWRKNTESMTKAVQEVLTQFNERFDRYPKAAQLDDGKEFNNVGVKTFKYV
jgi:arginyl-tRNA synthetase